MSHIKAILALMIVTWPFEVQPLSRDTFQCTPLYIYMYPCGEIYMAYASSEIPFIRGMKVLHIMIYYLQYSTLLILSFKNNISNYK